MQNTHLEVTKTVRTDGFFSRWHFLTSCHLPNSILNQIEYANWNLLGNESESWISLKRQE